MRSLHETYKEHLLSFHNTHLMYDVTSLRMLFVALQLIIHTNLTRNLQLESLSLLVSCTASVHGIHYTWKPYMKLTTFGIASMLYFCNICCPCAPLSIEYLHEPYNFTRRHVRMHIRTYTRAYVYMYVLYALYYIINIFYYQYNTSNII